MFRNIMTLVLFAGLLSACSDSPTAPKMEEVEKNLAFSAKVEYTGYLMGLLAHHEMNDLPDPSDFLWPSIPIYGPVGSWKLNDSPAHTLVAQMAFGGLTPGETFALEYRMEWVNGETLKPFDFSPVVAFSMEYYTDGVFEKIEVPFSFQQVDRNRYRAEFTIPTISTNGYLLHVLPGLTVQCNSEGIKSFLLSDISYSGAGFSPGRHGGSVLFTGTCQYPLQPLPRYSVVPG